MLGEILLGLLGLVIAIFLVTLAWDDICDWIHRVKNRHPNAQTAEIIRKKLANGNYRVVAGVFNNRHAQGTAMEQETWEVEELDDELQAQFGGKNKILLKVTA